MTADSDDDALLWSGPRNSFQFAPEIPHEALLDVARYAKRLGYEIRLREAGLQRGEIVSRLRSDGPGYFLRPVRLQEDVLGRASTESVTEQIATRLASLAPTSELLITDPYLFPSSVERDIEVYSSNIAELLIPLLGSGARLNTIVDAKATSDVVKDEVIRRISEALPDLQATVTLSSHFHDRFWIADRARGVIMGTSLNKVGRKIFFMDSMTVQDVGAVVAEIEKIEL